MTIPPAPAKLPEASIGHPGPGNAHPAHRLSNLGDKRRPQTAALESEIGTGACRRESHSPSTHAI